MKALVALGPEEGAYLLIDSRPPAAYLEGHIPTAVSIPFTSLQKQKEAVLPPDKDQLIIFYCDGFTRALSPSSARVAEQLGYTNVMVFHAGMPAWKQEGGLVLSHPEDLDKMIHKEAYILIDLRDKAIAERGHLPGAISIPAAQLAGSRSLFPEDKSVLIILYTASGHDEKSFEIVKSWGYKNVSVLDGGVAAWRESQGKLFSGLLWTPSL